MFEVFRLYTGVWITDDELNFQWKEASHGWKNAINKSYSEKQSKRAKTLRNCNTDRN